MFRNERSTNKIQITVSPGVYNLMIKLRPVNNITLPSMYLYVTFKKIFPKHFIKTGKTP